MVKLPWTCLGLGSLKNVSRTGPKQCSLVPGAWALTDIRCIECGEEMPGACLLRACHQPSSGINLPWRNSFFWIKGLKPECQEHRKHIVSTPLTSTQPWPMYTSDQGTLLTSAQPWPVHTPDQGTLLTNAHPWPMHIPDWCTPLNNAHPSGVHPGWRYSLELLDKLPEQNLGMLTYTLCFT